MAPAWKVVWPMIVARSVVLPTPLRPSTASEPRSGTASATSSRMTVCPAPARSADRRNASAMRFTKVYGAHTPIGPDFLRRAFHQHLALHEDRNAPREAEHEVHVVLDDQDGDVTGKAAEHFQDASRVMRRDACRGFVEQ